MLKINLDIPQCVRAEYKLFYMYYGTYDFIFIKHWYYNNIALMFN